MNLWLSGPTASGKTTLAQVLPALGFAVVREHIASELFGSFFLAPASNCERLQEAIIRSRYNQWTQIAGPLTVFDRSIDEDIKVFCEMHRRRGFLTDVQFERLKDLGSELQRAMPPPDVILYMRPTDKILRDRVEGIGQPRLIIESLDLQLSLYADWIASRSESVIKLDNSACGSEVLQTLVTGYTKC